ncbi:MAG TPA: transcription termination factor NusA [Anaerolineales bacterium]|nr:transcription termination factor NusA [Anaerolineales bacterium]
MKNEFVLAFNEVLEEKGLPKDVVLEALEAAMVSAYRRAVNASNAQHVEAKIDPDTGKVTVFAEKEIVEAVQDERTEVTLEAAQKIDPAAELGGMVVVESTPKDFGRVAAQTARQVIQQRIREAERDSQMKHYAKQVGEIVSGIVQAVTPQGATLGLDMKAEGVLPRNQQIPGERFRVHDRVQSLLLEVKQTPRGPQIILSRSHRNFLRRLLENEVPEIYHGLVEIRSIAREPGQRSKVAVAALQPAVDPVGACVGIRGVRIQAIVRELNDEKIDVIEYDTDPASYIAKALSPARVTGVYLNEHAKGAKTATVVVMEDQLSLAIGRDGQNARLAAKLTSWRIDIKSLIEAAADSLQKLGTDPEYTFMAEQETDTLPRVEAVLAKKAEGRPVTPEEYQVLSQFVDRVERGLLHRRSAEKRAEDERRKTLRATIPQGAFVQAIEDAPFSDRLYALLSEAGYQTVGDVMLQMAFDSDAIMGLSGFGPKAMSELQETLAGLTFPEPEPVEAEVEAPAAGLAEEAPQAAEVTPTEAAEPVTEIPAVDVVLTPDEAEMPSGEAPALEAGPEVVVEQAASSDESPAEQPGNLDDIFDQLPEAYVPQDEDSEEEDDLDQKATGKKKKKKKKFVEVQFDPDHGVNVIKRHRKRDGGWDDDYL